MSEKAVVVMTNEQKEALKALLGIMEKAHIATILVPEFGKEKAYQMAGELQELFFKMAGK